MCNWKIESSSWKPAAVVHDILLLSYTFTYAAFEVHTQENKYFFFTGNNGLTNWSN